MTEAAALYDLYASAYRAPSRFPPYATSPDEIVIAFDIDATAAAFTRLMVFENDVSRRYGLQLTAKSMALGCIEVKYQLPPQADASALYDTIVSTDFADIALRHRLIYVEFGSALRDRKIHFEVRVP